MSDLISRADAIEAVENNSYGMGSRASVKAIKALPSAELPLAELKQEFGLADAVQGEWKAHRVSLDFICSNCGEACWSDFDYCPHYGARMKGGAE